MNNIFYIVFYTLNSVLKIKVSEIYVYNVCGSVKYMYSYILQKPGDTQPKLGWKKKKKKYVGRIG